MEGVHREDGALRADLTLPPPDGKTGGGSGEDITIFLNKLLKGQQSKTYGLFLL